MPVVYSFEEDEEEQGFLPATGSAILSGLELLERPSQGLKVGIKEALDDDEEGFGTGFMRGFTGEEEVRTQDYIDPEFVKEHPIISGIAGFAGDVLTDPLTYGGGVLAKAIGTGISATAKATPGYSAVQKAVTDLGATDTVQNLARRFNVSYGDARRVQEFGKRANDKLFSYGTAIDDAVNNYVEFAKKLAKEKDISKEDIDSAFRSFIEDHNYGQNVKGYKVLQDGDKQTRDFLQVSRLLGKEGRALAVAHKKMYNELLEEERALGIRTGEYGQQLEIFKSQDALPGSRGYLPHIATPQTRMKWGDDYKSKDPLDREGSSKQRGLEGTADEVNKEYNRLYGFNAFHTDPAIMAGVRYSNSAAAQSRAWFRKEVERFGLKRSEMKPGQAPQKGFQSLSDYVQIKDLDGTPRFYPKHIAKIIKEREGYILGKGSSSKFLKAYDDIQNGWKKWTLGVRPSYHTRNAVGNIFNAYMIAGVKNPAMYTAAASLQSKVIRGKPLSDTGNFKGTGLSEKALWDQMNANNVTSKHQYGIDVLKETEEEIERLAGFKQDKLAKVRNLGADNPLVEGGFKVGSTIEQNARIAVFIDKMRKARMNPDLKYYDPVTGRKIRISDNLDADGNKDIIGGAIHYANQEVKKSLFDYSDLSEFERTVLKRFMPFYTWSRKNIPAQLQTLVQNPQRLEQLDIARDQFEYMGGRPDEADIGPFWRGRVPIFLGGEKDGIRKVFSLLNYAPIADIERVYEAFGDPKSLLKDMTSPLIKVPFEQIFNYDSFRETPITEYKGQTKDFLGVKLPARLYNLAQILVPLADLNRVNPMGVFGEKTVDPVTGEEKSTEAFGGLGTSRESGSVDVPGTARMIRFFLGVQQYDIDLSKNQYWKQKNFVKDIQALKSKYKWAVAKGQNRRAQELLDLIDEVLSGDTRDPMRLGR
ncbi:MAG: hypothetical protein ACYTA3_02745 [Planctomycetota bacterium]|jgi:hypothetical protein